jgi:two-component system chemotaxis response regulator CheB
LRDRIRHRVGTARPPAPRASRFTPAARAGATGLVVVGTSTGGPPALEALLAPLPADFPWPIVIAQHMPASFTGPLARRIDQLCAIGVEEVTAAVPLEPGHAYVGRGDADVIIKRQRGTLVAVPAPAEEYPWHPSADRLVRTAMDCLPPQQLVGVLMTGMGYDGAGAMAQLHALGGRTIAEAEETAVVWGMPGELVKAGGADWVLPVQKIADKLQRLVPLHAADPKDA